MRIGINFGDNDYYNTFMPFMRILCDSVNDNSYFKKAISKDLIVKLFNDGMAYTLYKMFQSRYRSNESEYRLKHYLKIKVEDIYFNEEIDEKLKTYSSWANGSFFYVDTDNKQTDCW